MKVTITPDNLIVVDGTDIAEIAAFVNTLTNSVKPKAMSVLDMAHIPPEAIEKRRPKKEKAVRTPAPVADLIHALADVAAGPSPKRPKKKEAVNGELLSPQLAKVYDYLQDGFVRTPAMVADLLGIAPANASWRLKRLAEKGLAVKTGRGKYVVAAR